VTAHAAMAKMNPCDTQNRSDAFYWKHLGKLSVPSYKEAWERKRQSYEDNGFLDRVITSEDGPDDSIDAAEIERIARKKILLEG
jgi:exodeoxyribonuclease V alpha subunit